MLEGLCNPHMINTFSSQTLLHLLNSSYFILGQNLEAFVYQNIRSCCTSTKCFLEDLCKYHFKYIIVYVVCMVNKAASYSTMLSPTILLSHPFSTPSHFSSHVLQPSHIRHCTTPLEY